MTAEVVTLRAPAIAETVRNYVALTKPRIISLLLITTIPAMVVAEGGWPSPWLMLATLIGGTLSAAGANVINCWYDRDIDGIMRRTRSRPLVRGVIEPAHALTFGVILGSVAFVLLWALATPAAAVFATSGLLFYVFIYTIWLKRRTPQNIVIGGAAGAFPPLVGWAAVSGDASIASALMFGIIFLWTPPHFWALALRLEGDYREAGIPMLPVTHGAPATRTQIVLYTYVLVAASLFLPVFADVGWLYLAFAAPLGLAFLYYAHELHARHATVSPIRLYKYSLLYLAALFVAMAAGVFAGS